jgi:hypothetical protein
MPTATSSCPLFFVLNLLSHIRLVHCYIWIILRVVLKLGHFRNPGKVLKCDAGEGWRSSAGQIG